MGNEGFPNPSRHESLESRRSGPPWPVEKLSSQSGLEQGQEPGLSNSRALAQPPIPPSDILCILAYEMRMQAPETSHAKQLHARKTRCAMGGGSTTGARCCRHWEPSPLGWKPCLGGAGCSPSRQCGLAPERPVGSAAHQKGSQVFPAPQEESSGVLGQRKCLQTLYIF